MKTVKISYEYNTIQFMNKYDMSKDGIHTNWKHVHPIVVTRSSAKENHIWLAVKHGCYSISEKGLWTHKSIWIKKMNSHLYIKKCFVKQTQDFYLYFIKKIIILLNNYENVITLQVVILSK